MADRNLFNDVPEDLSALSDEDIRTLHDEHLAAIDKIAAAAQKDATPDDFAFIDGVDDVLEQMEAGTEAALKLKEELARRESSVEEARNAISELAAKVKPVEEPEPETLAAEVESESEVEVEATEDSVEVEPVVAATEVRQLPKLRRPMPRPSADHQAVSAQPEGFVASSGLDVPEGKVFERKEDIATSMMKLAASFGTTPPGFEQKVVVASVNTAQWYPEDRRLPSKTRDAEGIETWNKIRNITSPEAIVAAGGLCAPVTPYYGQQFISVTDRPVRDALTAFNADRGGVRYNPPIGIGTISSSDAIGIITAAEDGEGGTFATKSCYTVVCEGAVEVDVDIIFHCLLYSNLTSRTFPEQVVQINDTVLAAHARLAEINLLNGIKAASTDVTVANATNQGANSTLLGSVLTAAAGQRSRNRMAPDATLRALFPAWSRELLVADIVRSQFQRFDMSEAGLIALLRSYNIEPSFYLDGPSSGTAQIFGAQSAGALLQFPTTVQWALFPEGSFLYLDGGVLELGIVRDSVLNATNQFQVFGESFENVAFVGIESLWIETTVCPSGVVAAPATNTSFCS